MVLSVTMCHSLILDQIKAVKDALCSEQQLDDACEPHALFELHSNIWSIISADFISRRSAD